MSGVGGHKGGENHQLLISHTSTPASMETWDLPLDRVASHDAVELALFCRVPSPHGGDAGPLREWGHARWPMGSTHVSSPVSAARER